MSIRTFIKSALGLNSPEVRHNVRASFDAAKTTRDNIKHWAESDMLSADAEANSGVRQKLRSRSRYEVANNSYAKGLVQMIANDTIGTGPHPQIICNDMSDDTGDTIEKDFKDWAEEIRLPQKLRLMRVARCQDGETFAILSSNPKNITPVKLDINVIECDRVNDVQGLEFDVENPDVDGIKYDRYGNPVTYHVSRFHPGDSRFSGLDYMDVPAKYMIHMFRKDRPELHRGVPELTAALPLFAQLRRYNLATLSAAEAAADFSAILYTDSPPDGESCDVQPFEACELERNMLVSVPAGWKMGQLDPKHPTSNHAEFVKVVLSEIARCVCSTYGLVSGDFSGYNYASGRLDNQQYQKSIIVDRSSWEIEVLKPVFRMWFEEYARIKGLPLDYINSVTWMWDGFQHVDPVKEATANEKNLANGITNMATICASSGKDWYAIVKQRAKELKLLKQLGIPIENANSNTADSGNQDTREEEENEN